MEFAKIARIVILIILTIYVMMYTVMFLVGSTMGAASGPNGQPGYVVLGVGLLDIAAVGAGAYMIYRYYQEI